MVENLSIPLENNHYYDEVMEESKLTDHEETSNVYDHTRADAMILVQNLSPNDQALQNDCNLQTKVLPLKCQDKLLSHVLKNRYYDTKKNSCNTSIPELQMIKVVNDEIVSSCNKQINEIGNGFTEEIKGPHVLSTSSSLVPENRKYCVSEVPEKINRFSNNVDCKPGSQTSSSSIYSSSYKIKITEKDSIKCNECGLLFKQHAGLTSHMRIKHNHMLPYECNLCGIKQGSKASSTLHAKLHQTNNSFECELCDKVFYNKLLLINHESRYHDQFRCKTCDNAYKTKELLQKHQVTSHKKSKVNICGKSNIKSNNCRLYQEQLQNEHVEPQLITQVNGNKSNVTVYNKWLNEIQTQNNKTLITSPRLTNDKKIQQIHSNKKHLAKSGQLNQTEIDCNYINVTKLKQSNESMNPSKYTYIGTPNTLNNEAQKNRNKSKIASFDLLQESPIPKNTWVSMNEQSNKIQTRENQIHVASSSLLNTTDSLKMHNFKTSDTIHDQSNKLPTLINNPHVDLCEKSSKVEIRGKNSEIVIYEQPFEVQNSSNKTQSIVSSVSKKRKNYQVHSKTKTHVTHRQNELKTNNTRRNLVMTDSPNNNDLFQRDINVPSLSNRMHSYKIQNVIPFQMNKIQTFNTKKFEDISTKSIKAQRLDNKTPIIITGQQQDIQQIPSNKTHISLYDVQSDEVQKPFGMQNKINIPLLKDQSNKAAHTLLSLSCPTEIPTKHVNQTHVSISDQPNQDQIVQQCINGSSLSHQSHTLQTHLNETKTEVALSNLPIKSQMHTHNPDVNLSYLQSSHSTNNKTEVVECNSSNETHTQSDKMSVTPFGIQQNEEQNILGYKPYFTEISIFNEEKMQETLNKKTYVTMSEKPNGVPCINMPNSLLEIHTPQTHDHKMHVSLTSRSNKLQTSIESASSQSKVCLSHSHKPDVIDSCRSNIMQVPLNLTELDISKSSQPIEVQTHTNKMSVTTFGDQQIEVHKLSNKPNFTETSLLYEEKKKRPLNNGIYFTISDESNEVMSVPPSNFKSSKSLETHTFQTHGRKMCVSLPCHSNETQMSSKSAFSQPNDNQSHNHKPDVIISCLSNVVQASRNETFVSKKDDETYVNNMNVTSFKQKNEGQIEKPNVTVSNLSNEEKMQRTICNKIRATISRQPNEAQAPNYKPDVIVSCQSNETLTNHSPSSLPDISWFNRQNKTQIRLTSSDEELSTSSDQSNKSLAFQTRRKKTSVEEPTCRILNESQSLLTCQTGQAVYGLLNNASYLQMRNKTGYCRLCNMTFVSNKLLLEHFNYLHRILERAQKCNLCSNIFATRFNFQNHMAFLHMDRKLFVCDLCDEHFQQRHALESHKVLHQGGNWHKCPVCSKSFMKSSTYKKHLYEHCENPLKCKMCFLKFTRLSDLIKHQRIHKRKHVYLCEFCSDLSFLCIDDLQEHVKMFHGSPSIDWTI